MNPALAEVLPRILKLATGALAQANTHAVYDNPDAEHWDFISVINAAHAGELFLKAAIAQQHPLLIFKDVFTLNNPRSHMLDIETMIRKGRTHEFEKLPQILWASTGIRINNMECFERLRNARNAIQHFCAPEKQNFRDLSLEFIYTIVDPLIAGTFNLCAIEFYEDEGIGYDHTVASLLRRELRFTIPEDFYLSEIDMAEELQDAEESYRAWIKNELVRVGKSHLFAG